MKIRHIAGFFVMSLISTAYPSNAKTPSHAERNRYALRSGTMDLPYRPRRGYADGPYGQVHFRDTGVTGATENSCLPLILCPMAPHTSKQFSAVYELFKRRGVRAIGVDTPGFGESDPTPFVPAVEDWAVAIVAVLDHLGIEKAHVLGHHGGSSIATEVALQFPERVEKLILQGPIQIPEEERLEKLRRVQENEIDLVYKSDGSHLQETFKYRTRAWESKLGRGRSDPKLFTRYCSEKHQGYAPFWTGHHAGLMYDDAKSMKQIQHRTLILTNTGDSLYNHMKEAHAKIRPDFDYKELKGGTGDVVDQMPEQWVDAVASFIKERGVEDKQCAHHASPNMAQSTSLK